MTDDQIATCVKQRCDEVFGAYAIIGIRADNHEPLIITNIPHAEAGICINAVMVGALGQGGFAIRENAEEDTQG